MTPPHHAERRGGLEVAKGTKVTQASQGARRRPRDRKAQIIVAAADVFYREGFHRASTEQIASAVGITAGALYRHFRSKQELLAATIIDVFERAAADVGKADALADVVAKLARSGAECRPAGVLWTREFRHITDEQRAVIRDRFFTVPRRLTALLRQDRPELSAPASELLAWATLAVLTSFSYHTTPAKSDQVHQLLHRMATAVVTYTPALRLEEQPDVTPPPVPGLASGSRRESLLAAAIRLFHQHGYHDVSIEDIGAAVGIASASVYNHFAVKSELLVTALTRGASTLQLGMSHALTQAGSAEEAMHLAMQSYTQLALTHHELFGALVTEVMNLPEVQRHEIRRLQHDYVAEWVGLLQQVRPEVTDSEARFLVHGGLTVVNDVSRTGHLRSLSNIGHELPKLALAVMLRA